MMGTLLALAAWSRGSEERVPVRDSSSSLTRCSSVFECNLAKKGSSSHSN